MGTASRRAARPLRANVRTAVRSWRIILQASVACALAYAIALGLGHEQPFFAPIAAFATVALSLAQRLRRSAELVVGNAVGILLADLLIARIGTGAWQVGLVVAIALTGALLVGGGPTLIMQAASAGILIATLAPPTATEPWNIDRFVDALIGGVVGLVVSALLMPGDPARHTRSALRPVLVALATGYLRVADALAQREAPAAQRALADLRATGPALARFQLGLDATRESVRLSPWYWRQRELISTYTDSGGHLDNALRNLRVLARQASIALERDDVVPDEVPRALSELAHAAQGLDAVLAGDAPAEPIRAAIMSAVRISATAPIAGMFTAPMLGQVRLSASDLLQATDLSADEATEALRAIGDVPRG
ncbi:MAG: FUSC family protein [Candidatus Nanopelagicales bacterium]